MREAARPLLTLVLALALAGCGGGRSQVPVRVDGQALPTSGVSKYDSVYVDARELAEALGVRMVFNPRKPEQGLTLQDLSKGKFVHLHTNASDCHVGGETVRTRGPTLYIEPGTKRPMAPVGLIAEVFGATVRETPDGLEVTAASRDRPRE